MLYKDFVARAAIAVLPEIVSLYHKRGDLNEAEYISETPEGEQLVTEAAELADMLAKRLQENWPHEIEGTVFFDPEDQPYDGIEKSIDRLEDQLDAVRNVLISWRDRK